MMETLRKIPPIFLLVSTIAVFSACEQLIPLMGEGAPPGYIDGNIPNQYRDLRNPFTLDDRQALDAGREVYEDECSSCHGILGKGDGPRATYVEPSPADFTAPLMLKAFREHQDYVFWWVSEGVAQTTMPAWVNVLSETERWQVILYSWYLGEQGAARAP